MGRILPVTFSGGGFFRKEKKLSPEERTSSVFPLSWESTFPKGEGLVGRPTVPQPPAAAPRPPKEPVRRLCEGLLPRLAEVQASLSNQSRPECSRSTDRMEPRRGPGESPLLRFPRALFGTFSRERKYISHERQATKVKSTAGIPAESLTRESPPQTQQNAPAAPRGCIPPRPRQH